MPTEQERTIATALSALHKVQADFPLMWDADRRAVREAINALRTLEKQVQGGGERNH